MTVGGAFRNFRSALGELVPYAERAAIGWRREDAYDEWDEIASSLYKGLVQEPLRWQLPESERESFELPPYDLLLKRYTTHSVVEVVVPGATGTRIFHAFATRHTPFDICECRLIEETGIPIRPELEELPFESVGFRLLRRSEEGWIVLLGE